MEKIVSFADDFMLVLKRESKMLISIASIVLICFILNMFDILMNKPMQEMHSTFFIRAYMRITLRMAVRWIL